MSIERRSRCVRDEPRSECRIDRTDQIPATRIRIELVAHAVHGVGESDVGDRIGEAERAPPAAESEGLEMGAVELAGVEPIARAPSLQEPLHEIDAFGATCSRLPQGVWAHQWPGAGLKQQAIHVGQGMRMSKPVCRREIGGIPARVVGQRRGCDRIVEGQIRYRVLFAVEA